MAPEPEDAEPISLLGETLPIRARGADAELIRESHELVQETLDSVREKAPSRTTLQVALMCAMNLAGELIQAQNDPGSSGIEPETLDRMERLSKRIDRLIED